MKRKVLANQWIYTLKAGKPLRSAISNEDYAGVLDQLENAWKEIHKKFPDVYEDYDLEDDIDDINNERDNLENYEDYDMTHDDVIENIDYLLSKLYDFCDEFKIWVDM